jgi:hypothetical protein
VQDIVRKKPQVAKRKRMLKRRREGKRDEKMQRSENVSLTHGRLQEVREVKQYEIRGRGSKERGKWRKERRKDAKVGENASIAREIGQEAKAATTRHRRRRRGRGRGKRRGRGRDNCRKDAKRGRQEAMDFNNRVPEEAKKTRVKGRCKIGENVSLAPEVRQEA